MYDLLIKNGTIIDGTGKERFTADVAVTGNKIAAIGDLKNAEAAKTVDATGRIVCPGFIDAHGHSDFTLFVNHKGESKIRQGITFYGGSPGRSVFLSCQYHCAAG